jgi:hypothetical protein
MNEPKDQTLAGRPRRSSLAAELLGFVAHHRKWWLLPILTVVLVLGLLVASGGSAIAPFLYAMF